MSNLHKMRVKLPTGRETSLVESLRFCYDLSETDTLILLQLLRGGEYTVDDLTRILRLSKASVSRGLTKLVELGFATRTRERRTKVGRPRYRYTIEDPEQVVKRIIEDFQECANAFAYALQRLLEEVRQARKELEENR